MEEPGFGDAAVRARRTDEESGNRPCVNLILECESMTVLNPKLPSEARRLTPVTRHTSEQASTMIVRSSNRSETASKNEFRSLSELNDADMMLSRESGLSARAGALGTSREPFTNVRPKESVSYGTFTTSSTKSLRGIGLTLSDRTHGIPTGSVMSPEIGAKWHTVSFSPEVSAEPAGTGSGRRPTVASPEWAGAGIMEAEDEVSAEQTDGGKTRKTAADPALMEEERRKERINQLKKEKIDRLYDSLEAQLQCLKLTKDTIKEVQREIEMEDAVLISREVEDLHKNLSEMHLSSPNESARHSSSRRYDQNINHATTEVPTARPARLTLKPRRGLRKRAEEWATRGGVESRPRPYETTPPPLETSPEWSTMAPGAPLSNHLNAAPLTSTSRAVEMNHFSLAMTPTPCHVHSPPPQQMMRTFSLPPPPAPWMGSNATSISSMQQSMQVPTEQPMRVPMQPLTNPSMNR